MKRDRDREKGEKERKIVILIREKGRGGHISELYITNKRKRWIRLEGVG